MIRQRCTCVASLYTQWHADQVDGSVLPQVIDILLLPEVRAALDQEGDVDEKTITSLTEQFPHWAQRWRESCDKQLRQVIRNSDTPVECTSTDTDLLSLPYIAFTCRLCEGVAGKGRMHKRPLTLFYPDVIAHGYLHDSTQHTADRFERNARFVCQDPDEPEIPMVFPWSTAHLEFQRRDPV